MVRAPTYSLVVPVFNEQAVLPLLFARLDTLMEDLDGTAEVVLVDDGSRDASLAMMTARAGRDPRYRVIALSRNFGHQVAITSGLDAAAGEATVVLDADLQDPPELVLALATKWREGFDVVCAQRLSREGESPFKRLSADLFYRVLSRLASVEIPRNVGDCRLVDRRVLEALRRMPERERFVRGLVAWVGFRQAIVPYRRAPRAAGRSNYPLRRMMRLAKTALVGFSEAPLRLALWGGMAVSSGALLYGAGVLVMGLTRHDLVPGWSSMMVVTTLLCGLNMLMTGVLGLYVGRVLTEVKARPLYVVDHTVGFEAARDARGQMEELQARLDAAPPARRAS